MKKELLFFVIFFISRLAFSQVGISIVFDGDLPNGTPKFVELYVIETTNFSGWTLRNHNNGNMAPDNTTSLTSLGTLSAGSYAYVIVTNHDDEFRTYFNLTSNPTNTVLGSAPNVNGDDAISLYNGTSNIDVYGEIGTDGTNTSWEYTDGYALRNLNTDPSSTFSVSEWTVYEDGVNNCSTNSGCSNVITLGSIVLPVNLLAFEAQFQNINLNVNLHWATASEQNNSHFSLERSTDSRIFSEIATIPGGGTTDGPRTYTYTDRNPAPGVNYYRLKQVDYDGTFSYSPIISVNNRERGNLQVYPSPADDVLTVGLSERREGAIIWRILNSSRGSTELEGVWEKAEPRERIRVGSLMSGNYWLVITQNGSTETVSFTKR